jgi:hypothetical protein
MSRSGSVIEKIDTTHVVVTGCWETYSGLPGIAFLNLLLGEVWEITLQIAYN